MIHKFLLEEVLKCMQYNKLREVQARLPTDLFNIVNGYMQNQVIINARLSCNWCDAELYRYDFNPMDKQSWSMYCHPDEWGFAQVDANCEIFFGSRLLKKKYIAGRNYGYCIY